MVSAIGVRANVNQDGKVKFVKKLIVKIQPVLIMVLVYMDNVIVKQGGKESDVMLLMSKFISASQVVQIMDSMILKLGNVFVIAIGWELIVHKVSNLVNIYLYYYLSFFIFRVST